MTASLHPVQRLLALATLLAATTAPAATLTIANFGGANGRAQAEAFQKPFAAQRQVAVTVAQYAGGNLAPIRAMVAERRIAWDVVEVESTDLLSGCQGGLFETLEPAQMPTVSQLLPRSVHTCGIGAFVWSTAMAHRTGGFKTAPTQWADFWNVDRFPGKRALRRGARYNLEFALMADGVRRDEVYRVLGTGEGRQRALNKLAQLLPHIVWWDNGAQPVQWLQSGEVAMPTVFNGRVAAANREAGATPLTLSWTDAIYDFNYWAIVRGSSQAALARSYIDFASAKDPQIAFSKAIAYGPTNFYAILEHDQARKPAGARDAHQALIDLSFSDSDLPSAPANMRRALPFSPAFWTQFGADIEQRFRTLR